MKKIVASMLLVPILAFGALACNFGNRSAGIADDVVVRKLEGGSCVAVAAYRSSDNIAIAMTRVECPGGELVVDAGAR